MTSGARRGSQGIAQDKASEAAVLGFRPNKDKSLFFRLVFRPPRPENQTKKRGKYNMGLQPRTAPAAAGLSWATIASSLRDFGLARSACGLASPASNHARAVSHTGLANRLAGSLCGDSRVGTTRRHESSSTSSWASSCAGFPCAESAETESSSIFESFDPCLDFKNGITNGGQPVAFIGLREQLGFNHARPVGERQELHRLAGDLVVRALLHDQATSRDGFPNEVAEAVYRAVAVPRHIGKQFQRVRR